ncbi:MAG: D-alanine--D-alanine ligase [Lentisphaeria bacterium]|nr:D-alanine--D-alanine ligase [Lentisphaeria bacterium]
MLEKKLKGLSVELKRDVSYRELTSLGVGSSLPFLADVKNEDELVKVLKYTAIHHIPVFILGGGTNLVGMDAPCPMLGIRLSREGFCGFSRNGNLVTCGGALRLVEIARKCAEESLGSFAKLAGIPGTVGGALRMNAGANGAVISEKVVSLRGYRLTGKPWDAQKEELRWDYRFSSIPEDVIVTEAVFAVEEMDGEQEKAAIQTELENRREREPKERSAGCAFRNVSDTEPAGKLIELCGFKETSVGDMRVSPKHANYLVNTGNASEADFCELFREVHAIVAEKTGYYLRPEIRFINPVKPELASPPKVNVLYGGVSSEREISLRSGAAVAKALTDAGFTVELSDIQKCSVTDAMRRADVVYPVLHGGFGEDGKLQSALEKAGLRFVGSGSDACALVMDKIASKKIADRLGIPTSPWAVITRQNKSIPENLKFPLILKVPFEGSSVGIIKVDMPEEWAEAAGKELALADEILVEEFVRGIEITVPIVHGEILPVIEIRSPHGFYDWDAKYVYNNGHTEYFCPAVSLPAEVLEKAGKLARQFYIGTRCRDILRVDFIVREDGTPCLLEGNALPGCTATSLVPKAAKVHGWSFAKMTSMLVYASMSRHQDTVQEIRNNTASPLLVALCRWGIRLLMLIAALPLLSIGFVNLLQNFIFGLCLIFIGLCVVGAEGFVTWLNKLEKK